MGDLLAHMSSGVTTVCRCWALTRRDGETLGFTDHDRNLSFDGFAFQAASGLTARALEQSTGFAVDNSEAVGVLSHTSLSEKDIAAGRFDSAQVTVFEVNWAQPEDREVIFRGTLGEISRTESGFRADLRGLSEALNVPHGRVYQRACSAVLGDGECRVDLKDPRFVVEAVVQGVAEARVFEFEPLSAFEAGWFQHGVLRVLTGDGAGLQSAIQKDATSADARQIVLWEGLRAAVLPGDTVQLVAGCDKRTETCKDKFSNFLNFRGFPSIPGEDWQVSYPRQGSRMDGGSLS